MSLFLLTPCSSIFPLLLFLVFSFLPFHVPDDGFSTPWPHAVSTGSSSPSPASVSSLLPLLTERFCSSRPSSTSWPHALPLSLAEIKTNLGNTWAQPGKGAAVSTDRTRLRRSWPSALEQLMPMLVQPVSVHCVTGRDAAETRVLETMTPVSKRAQTRTATGIVQTL